MKKVLVLGAGLVSRPLVRYLLDNGFEVTVASRTVAKAERLIAGHSHGRALSLNVDDVSAMRELIAACDMAVSLLPATRHIEVARACLDLGKHMATTSYVSPQMRALDGEARRKGLLLLNEMGVDPGIDHMSAMKVIHREEAAGGTLVGFSSWCGGLPAPEANDNPFGYKFSWSPKGVLIAARNGARYLKDGRVVEVLPERLFADPASVDIPGVGNFEGYPNRDSVAYMNTYGFDERVRDMFRGTLRNKGHCRLYTQLIELGLLEDQPRRELSGLSCLDLMEKLFGKPVTETIPERLGVSPGESPIEALGYIGLLEDRPIDMQAGTLMDLLADRMNAALCYKESERDMLLMRHDITFSYADGDRRERITAVMVDYGIPGQDSSMARTVSLPTAIGVRMLLEDRIKIKGVHIPIKPEIYEPVLAELERLNIAFSETRSI
ncbi:MAG TPA: saccharopine dehydrogenase C-terminal domain-containing protein [Myxococcota bacterium]|nr:saccharopine dehydrogenase C-terminal domain-containing protein [Myxococcota bacterium]